MNWKNTRQVFPPAGAPPRSGSTIRAIIGSTRNIRKALTNRVVANNATSRLKRDRTCAAEMAVAGSRYGASERPTDGGMGVTQPRNRPRGASLGVQQLQGVARTPYARGPSALH